MKELLRIYHVIELFEKKEFCTKQEILEAASRTEQQVISYETWNRLRKKMERDYDFVVTYDKKSDMSSVNFGHKIDKDKLMSMLHHFKTMRMMEGYVEQDALMIEHLEFETGLNTGAQQQFETLHHAILKKVTVTITHQGYRNATPYAHRVNPLYFKQYQNRWYLIGELADKKQFRAFGMDRIMAVVYDGVSFNSRIVEAKQRFSEVVGLNLSSAQLQEVVIAFDPDQKPYLESLKLHHTQEVVEDSANTYTIKITVKPNYELQQQIQKFGDLAQVLQGDWICY